jgi:pyrimidine operon attenuation protein/uracil phosphoribosyltransferase
MATTVDIEQALTRMSAGLKASLKHQPLMVGIHTGGVWVAQRLHRLLDLTDPLGTLDISFYRDDFTRLGINPQVKTSNLPVNVEDRNVILVDDVLHTGRTIRAAMNEIFDYGRPASVALAVLIARDGRELPIQADIVGQTLTLDKHQHIKLMRAHDPHGTLSLSIQEAGG